MSCKGMNLIDENNSSEDDRVSDAEKDKLKENSDQFRFLNEDYFDNWWSNIDSRVEKKAFGEHEEEIMKHSQILKSFRSEFETDSLLSVGCVRLIRGGKIDLSKTPTTFVTPVEVLVPGYNLNSFIPNTSSLTFTEMVFIQSVIEAGGPNQDQAMLWTSCQRKLKEEQKIFMEYAEEQWASDNHRKLGLIKKEVKELMDQIWKVRLERVFTLPKFYHTIENIPLKVSVMEQCVDLKFIKTLESVGQPARIYLPNLWIFNVNVNTVIDRIESPPSGWSRTNTACYKKINQRLLDRGYHPDVSRDKVCEALAKENNVNIVMSSSAFSHLLSINANQSASSWNLPLTVIEYETDHGMKRIVFIDKKLPSLSMTALDRNKYYAKIALKKLFVSVPQNYRDQNNYIYDADSVETFGVVSPLKKKTFQNSKKRKKIRCAHCLQLNEPGDLKTDSASIVSSHSKMVPKQSEKVYNTCEADDAYGSDDSDQFCIDLGEDDTAAESNVAVGNSNKQDHVDGELSKEQECDVVRQCIDQVEEPSHIDSGAVSKPQMSADLCSCTYEWVEDQNDSKTRKNKLKYQVVYNLWEFNSSASLNYLSKNCSKDLKVLIRTTLEGQVTKVAKKTDELTTQTYKLSPKLEYQTEFGAEQATLSEIIKEWASLYIRPATTLARVRLDGVSGELIQIQMLNLNDLAAESQRLYTDHLENRLAPVHNILVKLSGLPAGRYMLSYTTKSENFVTLQRSVETGGHQHINMHLRYSCIDPTAVANQRSPFPLLDTTIRTPTIEHFRRIPCTFAPKKIRGKQSLLKDNSAINPPVILTKMGKKKKKRGPRRKNKQEMDKNENTTGEKC